MSGAGFMNKAIAGLLLILPVLVIQGCSSSESDANKAGASQIDGSQSVRINGQPVARLLEDSDGRAALQLAGCDIQQQGERSDNVRINGVDALTLDAAARACEQLSQVDVSADVMIGR
jgi:hypothetical protein